MNGVMKPEISWWSPQVAHPGAPWCPPCAGSGMRSCSPGSSRSPDPDPGGGASASDPPLYGAAVNGMDGPGMGIGIGIPGGMAPGGPDGGINAGPDGNPAGIAPGGGPD